MNNNLKELIEGLSKIAITFSYYPTDVDKEIKILDQTITILKTLSESSKIVPEEKTEDDLRDITWAEIQSFNLCRQQVIINKAAFMLKLPGEFYKEISKWTERIGIETSVDMDMRLAQVLTKKIGEL